MSFLHDSPELVVRISSGVYELAESLQTIAPDGGLGSESERLRAVNPASQLWRRRELELSESINASKSGSEIRLEGRARLTWRTRNFDGRYLTTIALSSTATAEKGAAKSDPSICLFQVTLKASTVSGMLLPYPSSRPFATSDEDRELELRYRNKHAYGVGHGTSVCWNSSQPGPHTISTTSLPAADVPAVRARKGSSEFLKLEVLADPTISLPELQAGLREFVADYSKWAGGVHLSAKSVPSRLLPSATAILNRIDTAIVRMEEGIVVLGEDENTLRSFHLANEAMLMQMARGTKPSEQPTWRPFQLAFILLSLASTVNADHDDRSLVDLIWFPTGGGKTEAYLGLAAIEMIRRRLVYGNAGGGTAVVTRYTMRLLTAQQFQRAAALMCALQILRQRERDLSRTPAFTIGLWLGNSTTPGTFTAAKEQYERTLREAQPKNRFQIRECPWCGEPMLPARLTKDVGKYGFRADRVSFEAFCPRASCEFHGGLPVQVVDEAIYENPPTMLVATVDKFARLAWIEHGAKLFGLGGSNCRPPSLVIQDELHLISGPLGTIVGVYEAAIRALLSWTGTQAKVVASTATTRAASAQVKELMGAKVALFPPSGIDADDNYFAEPDPTRPGRLYVGIMPQAHTPSWALGQISANLLQAPISVGMSDAALNSYWTLVVYHNSLRELGRTVTILRDDVRLNLERMRLTETGEVRVPARNGVEELNGNVESDELLRVLDQLSVGPLDSGEPLDALATTNILSVGIDVPRLGLMLVNGQPKSTSEYIQATSRVGRGLVPGLVVSMLRSSKPRDRSVFESFASYHDSLYRYVEPSSVSPWALQARRRALRAALVILIRHGGGLSSNDAAQSFARDSAVTRRAVDAIVAHVGLADASEQARVTDELNRAVDDWARRAGEAAAAGSVLRYKSREPSERLLRQFTESGVGWPVMNSMRSVDQVVRIRAEGER
jgi:hypothetical protein